MTENHDIPAHLIPSEKTVLAASEEEKELNEELDTERWVYTEAPDDKVCPYCGKEYKRTNFASNVRDASKGVCPYPVEKSGDFITKFVQETRGPKVMDWQNGQPITRPDHTAQAWCGPEYADELVGQHDNKDYDLRNI